MPPNERLQELYHPWTSYLIVPLFALANAGIVINGDFLRRRYASPITWAMIVATSSASRSAILGASWLVTRLSPRSVPSTGRLGRRSPAPDHLGHRLHLRLLIADARVPRRELDEAKLGVLAAARRCPRR